MNETETAATRASVSCDYSVSSQVAWLEWEREAWMSLCGEVLANVRSVWDKGLVTAMPAAEPERVTAIQQRFTEWLNNWEAQRKALSRNVEIKDTSPAFPPGETDRRKG